MYERIRVCVHMRTCVYVYAYIYMREYIMGIYGYVYMCILKERSSLVLAVFEVGTLSCRGGCSSVVAEALQLEHRRTVTV